MTDILLKRGTTAKINAYTGTAGEPVYNSETKTIHLMNGSTKGGTILAKKTDIPNVSNRILMTGNRGQLSGYETLYQFATTQTVTPISPDTSTIHANNTAVKLTFSGGKIDTTSIKIIMIYDATSITCTGITRWNPANPTLGTKGCMLVVYFHNADVIVGNVVQSWSS